MASCPKCFTRYPDEIHECEVDGSTLVPDATLAGLDRDLAAGEMIGDYKVESKLGEGGFGTVYRAIQPLIGKGVAIKVLSRRLSSDPEMVSRFVAEARSANQIRSKHIVDIFGFGALPDGRQYYVMELLHGAPLDVYLKDRGRIPPAEAVAILRGVARALDAAHASGIVHRDLKPENIFLIEDEEHGYVPKLLDFGIAKLMSGATGAHKTRTGVPMGTPYYMSPEQCRGDKIDHHTDVYSLGVVAFQLLSGQLVFNADSFMQLMFQHVSAPPPKLSQACPELGTALDEAVAAMLEKSPSARPHSAGAAVEALARAAAASGHSVAPSAQRSVLAVTPSRAATPSELAAMGSAATVLPGGAETLSAAEAAARPAPRRTLLFAGAGAMVLIALGLVVLIGVRKPAASAAADASVAAAVPVPVPAPDPSPTPKAEPTPKVEAAPAERVKLTIVSDPKEVEVFLGDRLLGKSTTALELERGADEIELTLKAKGFEPKKLRVKPAADSVISVELRRSAAPGGGGKKPGGQPGNSQLEF